jgi:tRNA modification GTPase
LSVLSYDLEDTIVAIASGQVENTPIGIVRLSGVEALSIAQNLIKAASSQKAFLKSKTWGQMFRCELVDRENEYLDDGLGVVFHGPHSFTGEDVVEWHIHGSQVILQQVVKECIFYGARQASAGEFSYRAFLNEKISLDQAEGIAARIGSENLQVAMGTASAMKGELRTYLFELREDLTRFKGFLELEIDFLDQGYSGEGLRAARRVSDDISEKMMRIVSVGESWKKIKKGMQFCIIGPPNAGKSTLFNALVGEERSIVSDKPGTTRDTVMELAEINGIQWSLWDTAGIHDSPDCIEKQGILKSREKLEKSDAVVFLLDPFAVEESLEFLSELKNERGFHDSKNFMVFWGKSDLLTENQKQRCLESSLGEGLEGIGFLSSEDPKSFEKFRKDLEIFLGESLKEGKEHFGSVDLYVNERQLSLMKLAKSDFDDLCEKLSLQNDSENEWGENLSPELLAEDMKKVLDLLDEILGRVEADEVVEKVFQNFCIGK